MAIDSVPSGRSTGLSIPLEALDYYVLRTRRDTAPAHDEPESLIVEEFIRDHDFHTIGVASALWTLADGWHTRTSFSREMRIEPALLAGVAPISREEAEVTYHTLSGAVLPRESQLREHFDGFQAFDSAPLLRLNATPTPEGFRERRIYRVLFAKELDAQRLASLREIWGTAGLAHEPDTAVGGLLAGGNEFTWTVRRLGRRLAWCLDLIVLLRTDERAMIGRALHQLTATLRGHGLIPVTTERFA